MKCLLQSFDDTLALALKNICFSKQVSNPKKATKCLCVWWLLNLCLWLPMTGWAASPSSPTRFVSLTLCSDRLLMALARPEQIAAMSPFSTQPQSMLAQINQDKPVVRPRLSELLPYADATILLNERFYPQLLARLKSLGFRVIGINDSPQTPDELFVLLRQLAELTGNQAAAEALITQIRQTTATLTQQTQAIPLRTVLALSENGIVNLSLPQNKTLLSLLNLRPAPGFEEDNPQFSVEQLLLANPQVLLTLSVSSAYSERGQWLTHPALASLMQQGRAQAAAAAKYTFCFDHGVWQGAVLLMQQLQPYLDN